ncbi:unnamed protein product [Cylicocyclus nassatus]|uniref:Helitron helicase-like domain-containing protein n=1 Tax=Cylicocyclus nassatus TaxID=53992 RepID=A0AA36DU33_CYLNA|nr:unnamed protein product [Cylicocyclus nassatus]
MTTERDTPKPGLRRRLKSAILDSMTTERDAEARSHEERISRLGDDQARHAEARSEETAEQRESRLDSSRMRTEASRRAETGVAHPVRLERNRAWHVHTRQTSRRVDLHLAALNYDAQVDYLTHPKTKPPGMCCSSGKVDLPPLREPPEPLRSYMSGTSAVSRHFLQNIEKYTACFQMTSFGTAVATPDVEEQGFMPTFKVEGQVYHRVGSLLPNGNDSPKFLQLYFVCDEQLQADQRCGIIGGTRPESC